MLIGENMIIRIRNGKRIYEWVIRGNEKDIKEFIENLSISLVDVFDVKLCREFEEQEIKYESYF